jgi:hypothetical protein
MFQDGGWVMWPLLVFGLIALASAFHFAIQPRAELRGFVEAMARALLFSSLAGSAFNFMTVAHAIEQWSQKVAPDEWKAILVIGIGESLVPCGLGFVFLALTWMLLAVGRRRLDARKA